MKKLITMALALSLFYSTLLQADELSRAFEYIRNGEFTEAFPLMEKEAKQGNVAAQGNLATMYLNGNGVEKNVEKAAYWYQKAAESGENNKVVTNSMFQMGILYSGYHQHKKDLTRSTYWFEQAARAGDIEAMNQTGIRYYDGAGVEKNYATAMQWFRKAAEAGHPESESFIGDLYRFGRSVDEDLEESANWYRKSAEKNYPHALYMLGVYYSQGISVEKDSDMAYDYYKRAAAAGYPPAKEIIQKYLSSLMDIKGISTDPEYGYTADKAIRTGGPGGSAQRQFLSQLRGPDGQKISYQRTGVCGAYESTQAPFGQALIDCYSISYEGQEKPVTLYLDYYKREELWAPQGFTLFQP